MSKSFTVNWFIRMATALAICGIPGMAAFSQDDSLATGPVDFDGDTEFVIEFPGGTIPEYLSQVQAAAEQAGRTGPLNIVVTQSARDFLLPSIEVKTNLEGAVGCLEACSTEMQFVVIDIDPTGYVQIVKLEDRNPPVVQVMNVKAILGFIKKEDFISAIGIGLEMAGGEEQGVNMKLHEETGLFFVKGPRDRIEVIEQIVGELGDSLEPAMRQSAATGGLPGQDK